MLMAALACWGIGRPSMFGSEADTYWAAHLPWSGLAHLLRHVDAVHGLYYGAIHVWSTLDPGVVGMRVPSAVAAVATVLVTALLGRRLSGSRLVGVGAGMLLALSPTVDNYAQVGRSYELVALLVALTVLALLRALEEPGRRRRWVVYGALVTLAGYLHEMTLLALAAYAVTLLLAGVPRPVLLRWFVSSAAAAVLVLPLVGVSVGESAALGYLRPPGAREVRTWAIVCFGTPPALAWVLAGLAVVGAVGARRGASGVGIGALCVPLLVVPPALLMAVSHVRAPIYDVRYVLYGTIPVALLAAHGAHRIAARVARASDGAGLRTGIRVAVVAVVCLAAGVLQWPAQRDLRTVASRHQDLAGAAAFLAAHARPGDGVLFLPRTIRSTELGYPGPFRALTDLAAARSPAASGTLTGVDRPSAQVFRAMDASPRIWVVGEYPLVGGAHGVPGVARRLRVRYTPTLVGRFAGADVTLYVRASPPTSPR